MKSLSLKSYRSILSLFTIIFLAVSLSAQSQFVANSSAKNEMLQIEKGLQPAVQLKGKAKKTFKITERMKHYNVPGMSLAVVRNGRIHLAKGFGIANPQTGKKVDVSTLFQAGSISKPLAALAALKLVDKGKVELDKDVNFYLKSWKLPENKFTKTEKVTLRRLLTHTAGLTVHGFPGYQQTASFPDDIKVLNGKGNTGRIFVDTIPGTKWRYSGGGYTVMERLVEDVSEMSFADFLQKEVLGPLGMTNSTFAQPLPKKLHGNASAAFNGKGKLYKGFWHNYPEQAAAGLWTTPSDLAKYCIEIQKTLAGKSSKVLSQKMVKQMLTKDKNNWGLGPSLRGVGENLTFGHGGKNAGFTNNMVAFAYKEDAVIVMTSADRGGALNGEIQRGISDLYKWEIFKPRIIEPIDLTNSEKQVFTGIYEANLGGRKLQAKLSFNNNNLVFRNLDGDDRFILQAVGKLEFIDIGSGDSFKFKKNTNGTIESVSYNKRINFKKIK